MRTRGRALRAGRWTFLAVLVAAIAAVPAAGVPKERPALGSKLAVHLSQSVALRYWAANPEAAPEGLKGRAEAMAAVAETAEERGASARGSRRTVADLFNRDAFGLPQNEESVTACRSNLNIVLEGTNDFRGLVDPEFNFTGWHFSNNGGRTLTNEGLLPPVPLQSDPTHEVPSGGDPVKVAEDDCDLYAGSLAYDPFDPFGQPNGIAVYKSRPEILASCDTTYPNSANPECWPVRRLVAESEPMHFLDKEWIYVGRSGDAVYVWVVYADFAIDFDAPLGFTGAEIKAVRCDENLTTCTSPIEISNDPVNGPDGDVQFADVTIGADGRVYVTWSEIVGELPGDPDCPGTPPDCEGEQTFIHKIRIAEPGSVDFGPERVIYAEDKAIPFGGFLQASDFRVATYPKNEVAMLAGGPRIFVVWDACKFRPLPFVCEDALIKLSWSDDFGATWTEPIVLSRGGVNYFPAISLDRRDQSLALAWFTHQFDAAFDNQQDVVLMTTSSSGPRATALRRLTAPSNETEADPLLGGSFIGDYIEAFTHANRIWVGYNANYRKEMLLGPFGFEGTPVNQQDNYLVRTGG